MRYISSDTNIWLDFDAIAKFRKIPLLTGDNALRKAAVKEQVEVIGTIGLLDRLYDGNHISKKEYQYCLQSLLQHQERRLPRDEIVKRLERDIGKGEAIDCC